MRGTTVKFYKNTHLVLVRSYEITITFKAPERSHVNLYLGRLNYEPVMNWKDAGNCWTATTMRKTEVKLERVA